MKTGSELRFIFMLKRALSLLLTILFGALSVSAAGQTDLPKVLVLATGGTIAGEQREPGSLGGYEIKKSVNEIVADVPDLHKYAQIETEQFLNIASDGITPEIWLQLARRINEIFKTRQDIAGIVVTHGTDRLEETAFFLDLTVKSRKPVIVVGAQRPSNGISSDGPLNLFSAVRVAASAEAPGKGVMIVMDQRILAARDAEKEYARSGGFVPDEMGMLGIVAAQGPEFFYSPVRRHTSSSEFDVDSITALPRVDIQYSYAGGSGGSKDARAIIVATTGFTPNERTYYSGLQRRGIVVATTFPSGDQVGLPTTGRDTMNAIVVKHLLPTHARILMMLALTKTQDLREIQRIFNQY
jgi:L-asparaginase type II